MEASTLRRAVCAFSRPSAHPSRSSRRALTLPQRRSAFLGLPHPFLSAFLLLTSLRITWVLQGQKSKIEEVFLPALRYVLSTRN